MFSQRTTSKTYIRKWQNVRVLYLLWVHVSSKLILKLPPNFEFVDHDFWCLIHDYCSKIRPILSDLNVNMKRSPKSYLRLLLLLLNRPAPPRCRSSTLKTWTSMTSPAQMKSLSPRWVQGFSVNEMRNIGRHTIWRTTFYLKVLSGSSEAEEENDPDGPFAFRRKAGCQYYAVSVDCLCK